MGAVTETITRLQSGDRAVATKVDTLARQRKPALLEPITQVSLRRELKRSELPAKRVQRLKLTLPPSRPVGDWMVIRWYELDDALRDIFRVG